MANAGCGLLAISKAIDALAAGAGTPAHHSLLAGACWLIVLALIFDALDGKVARMTDTSSEMGAQLDSFADCITFGVAPAMVAKAMLEAGGTGAEGLFHPRLNFLAAAIYALLAVVRLARFNLTTEPGEEHHRFFQGLPSPAAAGTLAATMLMILSLGGGIEGSGEEATAVGKGLTFIPETWRMSLVGILEPFIILLLPTLGFLMVSQVRYGHAMASAVKRRGNSQTLVRWTVAALVLYLAPVPFLFILGYFYVGRGLVQALGRKGQGPDSLRKVG
jgi:CDP-diacylglycerol--serine O-phosphatidyltransferase